MTDLIMEMVVEYTKIFDRPGDFGDIDRGNPTSQEKWLRDLAKNPETKLNAYFQTEEDLQKLMSTPGFENIVTNPQTGAKSERVKEGNPDFGIGKYITLKRKLNDVREYVSKKTKQVETFDAGGIIAVTAYDDEEGAFVPYDYDTLGAPANGSVAKIKFNAKYLRPIKIGFVEVIEFVEHEEEDF